MIQNFKFSKLKILTFFLFIGIWLLGWTYFIAYNGRFYNSLFWTSVLTIGLSIFLIIIDDNISEKYKIVYLFIFGTIIYILNILPSATHFNFYDELATYEITKSIYENGNLDVITHFELPKYYPGLGLMTVIFKMMTNLDIFTAARILIYIVHSFVLIFLYLFLKKVSFSERIAAIGAFIYATNPMYVYFHSLFSYESIGIFFGICLLYLASKRAFSSFKENSVSYPIVMIILIASLTITHHLSSLMILLSMILLMFATRYNNYQTKSLQNFQTYLTFLTTTFIFVWMLYVATAAVNYLFGHFINRFMKIFELSVFGGSKIEVSSASLNSAMLPNYELIIDTRIYVTLLIFLSIIGIITVIRDYENKNIYLYVMIIYGPILYFISLGFILTSGQELAIRMWGFLYIGLSLMVAISMNRFIDFSKSVKDNFVKISVRSILFSAIIFIIMGGISIGDKPIHRVPNDLLSPKLLGASGSMTIDVFRSAEWFEYNFGKYNNISQDMGTASIFAYYAGQNPVVEDSYKIFFPDKINKKILDFIKYYNIKYIIVDRRITLSLAEYGVYFGAKERKSEYQLMGYGSKQPLLKKSIEKFDYSEIVYKIYDNGNIGIYSIY